MADHQSSGKAEWDGRFGDEFDQEVSSSGFTGTVVGTVLVTAVAIVSMLFLFRILVGNMSTDEVRATPPTLATGAQLAPPLPRLQAYPEAEFEAFKAQMEQRLESYGWVDQSAGIAHIPVDAAMALVLDHGVAATIRSSGEPIVAPEPTEEEPAEEAPAAEAAAP